MSIYAIGDLHLSSDQEKPMDIFGPLWQGHVDKLCSNWDRLISDDDLVIIPGDISWAMRLNEAAADLHWLAERPGSKLLIRGNHDYWWSSIGKVRSALSEKIYALQNDHFTWSGWAICGIRGWLCPGDEGFDNEHDQKIFDREVKRLQLSLESIKEQPQKGIIVALHFPPFNRQGQESGFTVLMESYKVKYCLFGHIHDSGRDTLFQGIHNGVCYRFVAADGIDFSPLLII